MGEKCEQVLKNALKAQLLKYHQIDCGTASDYTHTVSMEGSLYNQKAYVCYRDNTNFSSSDSVVVWWVGSVDELSRDLLQGTEGLLELEAFGDGLLLCSQDLLL